MRRLGKISLVLLAGALLFGSCREKETVREELSVSPASIEAGVALKSYKISVLSNAAWTVAVEGSAAWLTLDRASGHDDATVTVRVLENPYKDQRVASILFKTAGGKEARVTLTQEGKEGGGEAPEENVLRLGTYNLRMSNLDKEGDNVWSLRKNRLKQSLIACDFDVFGIQEVSSETQTWLNAELKDYYTFRYFSPYAQNGTGDRAQGIGYRKDAFTLTDWHFFWAWNTPDTMGNNDTGDQGTFKRGSCCCILTHKATGIKLFFMNNHGCLNAASNKQNAHVYVEQEPRFNPDGLPSFFVGDMNLRESTEAGSPYMTFTAYWTDPYKVLSATERTGCAGSYNAYANPTGKSRIDYVFYRGEGITPKLYHCDNTLYGGLYASDHFPVWVEYAIEK